MSSKKVSNDDTRADRELIGLANEETVLVSELTSSSSVLNPSSTVLTLPAILLICFIVGRDVPCQFAILLCVGKVYLYIHGGAVWEAVWLICVVSHLNADVLNGVAYLEHISRHRGLIGSDA
jgi:hypothetical protein